MGKVGEIFVDLRNKYPNKTGLSDNEYHKYLNEQWEMEYQREQWVKEQQMIQWEAECQYRRDINFMYNQEPELFETLGNIFKPE